MKTEVKENGTIVTIHDERSSQVHVPLGGVTNWVSLRSHLWDDRQVKEWRNILDDVIAFEEGHLSGKDVLVSWHTGCYTLDVTRAARTVNIFLKGNG